MTSGNLDDFRFLVSLFNYSGAFNKKFSLYFTLNEANDMFKSINGILRFKTDNLDANKLLPMLERFYFIVLKCVLREVDVSLKLSSIQSI